MFATMDYNYEVLESIEHEAVGDFMGSVPAALAETLGVVAETIDGVAAFTVRRRAQSIMWNHAQGFGERSPASAEVLEKLMSFFEKHKARGAICLTPHASTEEFMTLLSANGYEAGYAYRKFIRDASPAPSVLTSLTVRKATTQDAKAFGDVIALGFGTPKEFGPWFAAILERPNWHSFVACDGERVVATGALYVSDGIGYLTFGATHPDARRMGAQRALLANRIEQGLALGVTQFVTETGEDPEQPEPSYRNILWAGFERSYLRDNWVKPL